MKTDANNNHNAVFSSPLPILIILLVIILAFAGKLNAGQFSTDAKNESASELKAMAEEKKPGKEIEGMVEGIGIAVEETMEVISDVFGSVFEDLSDGNDGNADSRGEASPPESRKRNRKARLTTLEELESGEGK
ncbi:MAG: hypothetical protein AB9888_17935 [Bacteroidales bacterium]